MTSGAEWKDMFHAARDGDLEMVRFQLDAGVDVDYAHPEMQSTALVEACLAGHREIAHLLLDRGADPTLASDMEECTPVEAARRSGLDDVVLRLRALGAHEPPPPARSVGRMTRFLRAVRGR